MSVSEEFDEWAASGRDRGMEERHWRTAKQALARMPVEPGDAVLDLGTGSGYAVRALTDAADAARGYGVDRSPNMLHNARAYTENPDVGFVCGDFEALPFEDGALDHAFSMEAIYYAADVRRALAEVARVLRPGGTFYCAVDFYEENPYSHDWPESVGVEMTLWSAREYREAFRDAGLAVAAQDNLPDRDVDIPPADDFPTEGFETREAMVERYRDLGTLLTVGVAID